MVWPRLVDSIYDWILANRVDLAAESWFSMIGVFTIIINSRYQVWKEKTRKWVTWHWWLTTFFVRIRSFFIGVKEVLFINVLKMIYLCIFQWLFFGQLSPFFKSRFFIQNSSQKQHIQLFNIFMNVFLRVFVMFM